MIRVIFAILVLSIFIDAKDRNILVYKDRGIKYYPRYVSKGYVKYGKASWYGRRFHRKLTASGERYNMYAMTAAHRTFALNTLLRVTNLANKKSVIVRVNDRGPFYRSRDIDLSYGAAKKIGLTKKGVAKVKIEVISSAKRRVKKKHYLSSKKYIRRDKIVQVASFLDKNRANNFIKKHKLKNVKILKVYLKNRKVYAYRVVVKCTPWEAKSILNSKKFKDAYIYS